MEFFVDCLSGIRRDIFRRLGGMLDMRPYIHLEKTRRFEAQAATSGVKTKDEGIRRSDRVDEDMGMNGGYVLGRT